MARATLVVGLSSLAGCGQRPSEPPAALKAYAPDTPRATPMPPPRWSATERATLQRDLSAIFAGDITNSASGLVVVASDGTTLFSRNATRAMTPASTLKLVIAATALDTLGPKHRFDTRFVATTQPDADGTLRGGLWLVGGGDPLLASDDLERGVGVLARQGIKQIDGTLQIDDTSFMGPEQNSHWDADDLSYDYAAGTSSIALDQGVVRFDVTPGPAGGAASIRVVPRNQSISFSGSISTSSDYSSTSVTIERKLHMPTFASTGSSRASDALTAEEPRNEYDIDGHIALGETQRYYKPVLGMPGFVGGMVAAMFAQRNIALAGGYRVGAAPLGAQVLWNHRSPPLQEIVREMLVNSNNHTAETLLRIVGESSGHPGTDDSGLAYESRELGRLGVPRDRLRVYDGSGLAPGDRVMPLTLAELIAAQVRGPNADIFTRSLPRVGLEGTVKHHALHAALGRTRAKSGHIQNVNGLAGTVQTERHGRIAFAFLVNDPRADSDVVTAEEDRALDLLAKS